MKRTKPKKQNVKFPSSEIATKYGYVVISDVKPSKFEVNDLKLVAFPKSDELYVADEPMRKRAVVLKHNLGLVDGQCLLDHQDKIPTKMRDKHIILSGTVLRNVRWHNIYIPFLVFRGDRWILFFEEFKTLKIVRD